MTRSPTFLFALLRLAELCNLSYKTHACVARGRANLNTFIMEIPIPCTPLREIFGCTPHESSVVDETPKWHILATDHVDWYI